LIFQNAIIGHFLEDEIVKRKVEEKWYLTLAEYPNATYPPFAVGQFYAFPQSCINAVLSAAKQMTMHWLDDVFIGGQIPERLKMSLIHISKRSHLGHIQKVPCYGQKYLIIHATPAVKKRQIYYEPCMESYRQKNCQAQLQSQEAVFQEDRKMSRTHSRKS
jgi:hypothetical protein